MGGGGVGRNFENVETKENAGFEILAKNMASVHLPGYQSDEMRTKKIGGEKYS